MINFSKTQLRPQEWDQEYRVSYWDSQVLWTHCRHSNMETVRAGRDSGVQTGLSLAETDHVTWILASHWSICNSGLREASEACNDCPGSCWDDARTHCVMPWSVHKLYWPWVFGLYVYVYVLPWDVPRSASWLHNRERALGEPMQGLVRAGSGQQAWQVKPAARLWSWYQQLTGFNQSVAINQERPLHGTKSKDF